jgi:hypothetical protein
MTESAMYHKFPLRGGPADGQEIRLPTRWDGYGYQPPPVAEALPNSYWERPLPLLSDYMSSANEAVTVEKCLYHLHVFQNGNHRWYEYQPEKQCGN